MYNACRRDGRYIVTLHMIVNHWAALHSNIVGYLGTIRLSVYVRRCPSINWMHLPHYKQCYNHGDVFSGLPPNLGLRPTLNNLKIGLTRVLHLWTYGWTNQWLRCDHNIHLLWFCSLQAPQTANLHSPFVTTNFANLIEPMNLYKWQSSALKLHCIGTNWFFRLVSNSIITECREIVNFKTDCKSIKRFQCMQNLLLSSSF